MSRTFTLPYVNHLSTNTLGKEPSTYWEFLQDIGPETLQQYPLMDQVGGTCTIFGVATALSIANRKMEAVPTQCETRTKIVGGQYFAKEKSDGVDIKKVIRRYNGRYAFRTLNSYGTMKLGFPSQAEKLAKYLKDYVLICGGVNLGYPTTQSTKYSNGTRKVAGFFGTGTDSHTICIMGCYNDEVYGPCFVTKTTNEVWRGSFSFKKSNGRKTKVAGKYVSLAIYPVQYVDRINANRRGLPSGVDEVIGIQPVGPVVPPLVIQSVSEGLTLVDKMEDAKRKAEQPGGTTGEGLRLAQNKYSPHMDIGNRKREKNSQKMWWNDIWRKGNKNTNKSLRSETYAKYKVHDNVKHMVENNYVFVNQGKTGGCFLASVLSILQLGGKSQELDTVLQNHNNALNKMKSGRSFEKLFLKDFNLEDDGYGTYWQPLQVLKKDVPDLIAITTSVDFMWFRYKALGRANRKIKGSYNPAIAGTDLKSTEEYNEKILAYLRKLLDDGYVFATPFNGHFIAYIGYNDNGFLALGSYGENADKAGLHEVNETFDFADALASCIITKVPEPVEQLVEQMEKIEIQPVIRRGGRRRKKINYKL